jgi:hypothetical protein
MRRYGRLQVKTKLIALALLLGLAGCPAHNPLKTNATGDALTRAEVRNESVTKQVELAKPHADETGKVHLQTATADLQSQADDLQQAKTSLQAERDNAEKLQEQYTKLRSNPWVKFALLAQKVFWFIVIGYVLAGIAAVVLSVWTGGAGAAVGSEILHLLPLANPFVWISKFISARK